MTLEDFDLCEQDIAKAKRAGSPAIMTDQEKAKLP